MRAYNRAFARLRATGATGYPAGHLLDVALLYRLAIERAEPGSRYHAVGEDGIETREIAEALGRVLKLPVRSTHQRRRPSISAQWRCSQGWTFRLPARGRVKFSAGTRLALARSPISMR